MLTRTSLRTKHGPTALAAVMLIMTALPGCGMSDHMSNMDDNTKTMASEIQNDRQYIQTLTEQMKVLATSLQELQRSSSGVFEMIMQQFKSTDPGKTPNIDDVLNGGPSGASGASGTSTATPSGPSAILGGTTS